MVNRYDNPTQAEFINTYVPIPFEQLYTLGKQAKENVDKALKEYSTTLDKWADFQSPSAADTQAYYAETYGRALPVAEELARNIDLIKTPEGRSKIYSVINNTDRAKLSMLRQSAEGLKERQKVNQRLMLEGKYNPEWHNVDFTNYNTLTSGIYNDVAPLAYKSVNDLVHPYVDNLKPSSMGTENGYLIHGVSKDRTRSQVNAHLSEILNTPEAQKHIELAVKNGASKEEATQAFIQNVYTAAEEKAWKDIAGVDQYSLLAAKLRADSISKKQEAAYSRNEDLRATAGVMQLSKIYQQLANSGSYTTEQLNSLTPEQLQFAYNQALTDAAKNGDMKSMAGLISATTIKTSKTESNMAINPNYDSKRDDVKIKIGDNTPFAAMRIPNGEMFGAVALNSEGVPVAEIPAEYILTNDKGLNKLGSWLTSGADKNKLINDALSNYGQFIKEFTESTSPLFDASRGMFRYSRINSTNYPYPESMLVSGKAYISESEVEAVLEALKGRYGNLDEDDLFTILTEGKHQILKKVKNTKVGDSEDEETYYEMNVGIPFDDPSKQVSFDQHFTNSIQGASGASKNVQYQRGISFNQPTYYNNSTL